MQHDPYSRYGSHAAPAPRRSGPLGPLLAILIIVLSGAMLWRVASDYLSGGIHERDAEPRTVTPRGDLAADEQATIELFRTASPSVVHITTVERRMNWWGSQPLQGTGSGFVWDADGYVVTNHHVVGGSDRRTVVFEDGTEYSAVIVGTVPNFDLAVLKIDVPRSKLRPIAVGESRDLQVGQKVFAIGSPFGLDHTLTTGVISGLEREILAENGNTIRGVIQTDAAINPGNSGGPLLDSSGRLIGVNTAIKSPSGASAGIGFAVPVDTVNLMVPQIIAGRRAVLGVIPARDAVARQLGVEGAVVVEVHRGSGADLAGLRSAREVRPGRYLVDVILSVGGKPVRSANDLFEIVAEYDVGDVVEVEVLRDRKRFTAEVTLQGLDGAR